MKLPTFTKFKASAHRQCFSLPDSIIYYISKNPKSPKIYQKLTHSCKYFFIKNPIIIFHCFQILEDTWKVCSKLDCNKNDFNRKISKLSSNCKIWIEHGIQLRSSDSNAAVALIPMIFQCDAKMLFLYKQNLNLDQFLFYARKVVDCYLNKTVIKSNIYAELPLEEIVANLSDLKGLKITFGPNSRNVSPDTVKNLLQIPTFLNIDCFVLQNVSQKFDIDTFYEYYRKQKIWMEFRLYYIPISSQTYIQRLKDITKNEYRSFKYDVVSKPGYIEYPGQDIAERNALMEASKMALYRTRVQKEMYPPHHHPPPSMWEIINADPSFCLP